MSDEPLVWNRSRVEWSAKAVRQLNEAEIALAAILRAKAEPRSRNTLEIWGGIGVPKVDLPPDIAEDAVRRLIERRRSEAEALGVTLGNWPE